jgi:hypothetical protein
MDRGCAPIAPYTTRRDHDRRPRAWPLLEPADMVRALVLAGAVLVAVPAHAQPSRTPPIAAPTAVAPPAPRTVVRSGSRRSPAAAVAISLGVTAGSLGLMAAGAGDGGEDNPLLAPMVIGFLVGPSTGHWYAGRAFNPAMGVRAIAAGVSFLSLVTLVGCGFDDGHDESDCDLAGWGMAGGALTYTVAGIYEIFDAASSATAYNRRHGFDVMIAPTALPAAGGASPGLALGGRF